MTKELIAWLVVVSGILGVGMGSMVWAYRRPLGNRVLFPSPVPAPSMPVQDKARKQFEAGCEAFKRQRFVKAVEQFTQVMELEPNCAEAFHNCGLAYANLGTDGLAARALVKASEYYDRQGNKAGLDLVKQQLQQLAERPHQTGTTPQVAAE
jgi:tetratricopeptide (TPR) repeat protein